MRDKLVLTLPGEEDFPALLAFRQEFFDEGQHIDGSAGLGLVEDLGEWLAAMRKNAREETVDEGKVPATTYLALREGDGRIVGMVDIRHRLNDFLRQTGGHIGYCVRKSERGQGYAKEILRLALIEAKALGINEVLMTCDDDNTPSERTILALGGVYQNNVEANGRYVKRFWIKQ